MIRNLWNRGRGLVSGPSLPLVPTLPITQTSIGRITQELLFVNNNFRSKNGSRALFNAGAGLPFGCILSVSSHSNFSRHTRQFLYGKAAFHSPSMT